MLLCLCDCLIRRLHWLPVHSACILFMVHPSHFLLATFDPWPHGIMLPLLERRRQQIHPGKRTNKKVLIHKQKYLNFASISSFTDYFYSFIFVPLVVFYSFLNYTLSKGRYLAINFADILTINILQWSDINSITASDIINVLFRQ